MRDVPAYTFHLNQTCPEEKLSMSPADIIAFTRRTPFLPFRIHMTNGRTYDVRHPDQVIPLRSRIEVGVGGDGSIADRVEHLSFFHVVRLEELELPENRPA